MTTHGTVGHSSTPHKINSAEQTASAYGKQGASIAQADSASGAVLAQSSTGSSGDNNGASMIADMQTQASSEMAANDAMTAIGMQTSMNATKDNLLNTFQDAENNVMKSVGSSVKSATSAS